MSDFPPEALLPDAPIHQLLSLKHNPLVKDMSPDQLRAFVGRLKELHSQSASLTSKLNSDSEKIKVKRTTSISAKRKTLLDDL